ncbi:MAG: ABC transporter substrate-binding protein [Synechococcus sp.]
MAEPNGWCSRNGRYVWGLTWTQWVRLMLLGLVCVALTACTLSPATVDRPYLLASALGDPATFNYYLSNDNLSRVILEPTLSGLTRLNSDTLEWEPDLAENWEVFDDGLRLVFTLQPDLKWSDGEPLTVEDVRFTFEDVIFNDAIQTSSRTVMEIGESRTLPLVRVVGDRQIEFQLPEPFAPFLQAVGTPILPKHVFARGIEQTGSDGFPLFIKQWGLDTPVRHLVSSGPYVLSSYVPGQRVEYRPNPHYYRIGDNGETLPKVQRFIRQFVASQDNQLLQFRSGSLDLYTLRSSDFQLLKREEDSGQFTVYDLGPTLNNSFFCFNQSTGLNPDTGQPLVDPVKSRWFTDTAFRQAVSFAVNRQRLIDSVLRGLGAPQISPISPASPFHLSADDGRLPLYPYDPDRAKQLLQEAGYTYNSRGRLLDPDGNEVRFALNTNVGNTAREAMAAAIDADLDRIGITVDISLIDFGVLEEKLSKTFDWDAVMLSLGGGGTEPNSGANVWRSTGKLHLWNPPGSTGRELEGRQVTDWEREIDAIFSQGTKELDFDKRKQLYDRFQIIVQDQLPLIGTVNPLSLVAVRDRVLGADPRPILGELWNLDELQVIP